MRRGWVKFCLFYAFATFPLFAQRVRFQITNRDVVKARLDQYQGNDSVRQATLLKLFSKAGCAAPNLSEQKVPNQKEGNIICVLPGKTDEVVLVGAHFDHVSKGSGIVDNWSGAALLPSLFQGLVGIEHRHTYVFVAFMGEERGLIGSKFYVDQLSQVELSKIRLMLTVDTIGLGQLNVWASRSDKSAVTLLGASADVLSLPLGVVDIDGFGISDEESFLKVGVKTVTVHSVTQPTAHILHSAQDAPQSINFQEYYESYRILACYLTVLDTELESKGRGI